jgi:hypothetical protein
MRPNFDCKSLSRDVRWQKRQRRAAKKLCREPSGLSHSRKHKRVLGKLLFASGHCSDAFSGTLLASKGFVAGSFF